MISEAAKKAHYKYVKNHYSSLTVRFPKEKAELLRQVADANGDSIRSIVMKAIDDYIAQHNK